MNQGLIEADNMSVTAGGVKILDRVSLRILPREIVTLIGPNGSGKTTLIKALMGLIATEGEIRRRPGLKIGYVPQQFVRDPSLPITVSGFLKLFAPFEAGLAALERTGILAARDKQMNALSGGELARVLLARAIAGKPDLLALDEPTASVDITGEASLYHLIGEIRDELSCGVLLISHDLHVVMAKATRVICLNRHICCEGEAEAVVKDPAFRVLFGKDASELALYAHHHRFIHTPSGELVPKDG
jgi:zinc transport system ATP-binding protein